jgi:hypothetical protein
VRTGADSRPEAKPTVSLRGVASQERAARAAAAAVRTLMPGYASFVYCTVGIAYKSLGDFSKAIEYQ